MATFIKLARWKICVLNTLIYLEVQKQCSRICILCNTIYLLFILLWVLHKICIIEVYKKHAVMNFWKEITLLDVMGGPVSHKSPVPFSCQLMDPRPTDFCSLTPLLVPSLSEIKLKSNKTGSKRSLQSFQLFTFVNYSSLEDLGLNYKESFMWKTSKNSIVHHFT